MEKPTLSRLLSRLAVNLSVKHSPLTFCALDSYNKSDFTKVRLLDVA